jgi:phosphate transport system substrate-binding protein
MNNSAEAISTGPQDEFEDQARRSGLVLPARRPGRVRDVAVIVAVLIIVSVGIGEATGWMNFQPASSGPPGLFGHQACVSQAGQDVRLQGALSEDSDPALTGSLAELTNQFAGSYGGCVAIGYPTASASSGLSALVSRQADFAVLESSPTASGLSDLPAVADVVPIGLSSVSVVYNIPGQIGALNLDGSVLASIYQGSISEWNAPAIAALNPGVNLPADLKITAVHRADASPLNTAFTGYLAAANASWSSVVGVGAQVAWPGGVSAPSSSAMIGDIANVSGALGYVGTGASLPEGVASASLENPAGNFVGPETQGVSAAATALANETTSAGANWTGISLLDAPGGASYPLSYLDYLVVYQDLGRSYGTQLSLVSAQWELTFLWWVLTDGGYVTAPQGFAELPATTISASQLILEKVTYDGKSVLETTEGSETGGETGEF